MARSFEYLRPGFGSRCLMISTIALERLHVDAERLGDLHEVALHELVPVVADDDLDQRVVDLEELAAAAAGTRAGRARRRRSDRATGWR